MTTGWLNVPVCLVALVRGRQKKKQREEKLTADEEKEPEKLGKENLKTIEEVYQSLKQDKEIRNWIEKIKSHKWVRIIEGENV